MKAPHVSRFHFITPPEHANEFSYLGFEHLYDMATLLKTSVAPPHAGELNC